MSGAIFKLLIVTTLIVGFVYPLTQVDSCIVISNPGEYVLNASLIGAPNNATTIYGSYNACLVIFSSNVEVNCDGYQITNDGTPQAMGILANGTSVFINDSFTLSNITVKNCGPVTGYNTGIYFFGNQNSKIINSTSSSNSQYGFLIHEAYNDTLDGNKASYNLKDGFILSSSLPGTGANTLENNVAHDNTYDGITSFEYGTTLINNTAYNNQIGFFFTSSSGFLNDHLLINNTAHSNSQTGIYLRELNAVTVSGAHLYNNSREELFVGSLAPGIANLTFSEIIIDNPLGNFINYTNLSIIDKMDASSAYAIKWVRNTQPLPENNVLFASKFVNITYDLDFLSSIPSMDRIEWHWLDSELGGFNESNFSLCKYNNTSGWTTLNDTPDTVDNMLTSYNLRPSSQYGILEELPPPVPPEKDKEKEKDSKLQIIVSDNATVGGYVFLSALDSGDPVTGVDVRVRIKVGSAYEYYELGKTNTSGLVSFVPLYAGKYKGFSEKSGYKDEIFFFEVGEAELEPEEDILEESGAEEELVEETQPEEGIEEAQMPEALEGEVSDETSTSVSQAPEAVTEVPVPSEETISSKENVSIDQEAVEEPPQFDWLFLALPILVFGGLGLWYFLFRLH